MIINLVYSVVGELHLMPLMVLACQMSPKQIEATFYACITAIINAGYLASYGLGGLLTYLLGITSTDFNYLWLLIVISSVFPLVTLLFLACLPQSS